MSEVKPDYWTESGKGYARTADLVSLMTGVKSRTLREWFSQGCPGDPGRYCPAEIVAWGRENKWQTDVGDPELSGGDSPALERYRDEKAKLARLDRLQREGELVRAADIEEMLNSFSSLIRSTGEQLRRQFGNDALQILDEALDECDRLIDSDGNGGDDQ